MKGGVPGHGARLKQQIMPLSFLKIGTLTMMDDQMRDDLTLKESTPPSDEEILAEARAWGFDSIEEFFAMLDEAHRAAEKEGEKERDEI